MWACGANKDGKMILNNYGEKVKRIKIWVSYVTANGGFEMALKHRTRAGWMN